MAVKVNNVVKEKIFNQIKNILKKKSNIIFAYIHGSFLGDFPFNDIDLALYIDEKKIDTSHSFDYCFQLSTDLTKKIGKEIDVQLLNEASVGFIHSVFKNGRLLFSRNDKLRLDLLEKNSLEYIDFYELSLQFIRESVF